MSDLETGLYRLGHTYTSFAPTINLTTDSNGPADGRPARYVAPTSAGTLEVIWADGTSKSYTITAAQVGFDFNIFAACSIAQITDNTTCTGVHVRW